MPLYSTAHFIVFFTCLILGISSFLFPFRPVTSHLVFVPLLWPFPIALPLPACAVFLVSHHSGQRRNHIHTGRPHRIFQASFFCKPPSQHKSSTLTVLLTRSREDTKEEDPETRIAVHCCLCYSFDRSLAGSWPFPVSLCVFPNQLEFPFLSLCYFFFFFGGRIDSPGLATHLRCSSVDGALWPRLSRRCLTHCHCLA